MSRDSTTFLDRPIARVLAALVIVLCGALLAYIHRDDLNAVGSPADVDNAGDAADDPATPCIQQRFAEIETMIDEGIVEDSKAALFRERAEAMCRATTGDGGQALPLPAE